MAEVLESCPDDEIPKPSSSDEESIPADPTHSPAQPVECASDGDHANGDAELDIAWTNDFDWAQFMSEHATYPARSALMFPHVRYLQKTLAEQIFPPGKMVVVRKPGPPASSHNAKVELVVENEVLVEMQDDQRLEQVPLDLVFLTDSDLQAAHKGPDNVQKLMKENRHLLSKKLSEFIAVGQFFELQDKENPLKVSVARILENHNGLVRVVLSCQKQELVHITSERCHRIGWAISYPDGNYKVLPMSGVTAAMVAPFWLFQAIVIKDHKFEKGHLMEVLDPETRGMFCPGYVSEVFNRQFFAVSIVKDVRGAPEHIVERRIICHRSSPEIYPAYWCHKHKLRLTVPLGISETDFTFAVLRKMLSLRNVCTPDSNFDIGKMHRKVENRRNCELQHPANPEIFIPVTIVRTQRHFVWVHREDDSLSAPPNIFPCRSNELFPCGFAKNAGLKYAQRQPQSAPSQLDFHFDLRVTHTDRRTLAFQHNEKKFIGSNWIDGELWLPEVYVNADCYAGPFLSQKKLQRLTGHYGPGPLPHMMKAILNDIITSAEAPLRQIDIADIVASDKTSNYPIIQAKFVKKAGSTRARVDVECCMRSQGFVGWLRMVLHSLDACPNLFSFAKTTGCPLECERTAQLSYMRRERHVNMYQLSEVQQRSLPKKLPIGGLRTQGSTDELRGVIEKMEGDTRKRKSAPPALIEDSESADGRRTSRRSLRVTAKMRESLEFQESISKRGKGEAHNRAKRPSRLAANGSSDSSDIANYSPISSSSSESDDDSSTGSSSGSTFTGASDGVSEEVRGTKARSTPPRASPSKGRIRQNSERQHKGLLRVQPGVGLTGSSPHERLRTLSERSHTSSPPPTQIVGQRLNGCGPRVRPPVTMRPTGGAPNIAVATVFRSTPTMPAGPQAPSPVNVQVGAVTQNPSAYPIDPKTAEHLCSKYPGLKHLLAEEVRAGQSSGNTIGEGPSSSRTVPASSGGQSNPPILSNPHTWTCYQLSEWINRTGNVQLAEKLLAEEVDGEAFMMLSLEDCIHHLNLKIGPAAKAQALIQRLKEAACSTQ